MSDRPASLRLTLSSTGFISALRTLEGQTSTSAKAMSSQMGMIGKAAMGSLEATARAIKSMPTLMGKTAANPTSGILKGFKDLERQSSASAANVGADWKRAFGGMAGQIGSARAQLAGVKLGGKFAPSTGIFRKYESQGGGGGGEAAGGGATSMGISAGMFAMQMATKVISAGISIGTQMTKGANDLDESSRRLSVSSRMAGQKDIDHTQLANEARAASLANPGVKSADVMEGATRFVALTGNLDEARAQMSTFATVSSATGTKMDALGESAAGLNRHFGISGEEFKEVFAQFDEQGKKGAIMMDELARGVSKLAASGAVANLKGTKGALTLGGMAQIARTGSGSADEAFTSVGGALAKLQQHAMELRGQGVKVYEKNKQTGLMEQRNPLEAMRDAVVKLGGANMPRKTQMLMKYFDIEGMKTVNPMLAEFKRGFEGAQGTGGHGPTTKERVAAGAAALDKFVDSMVNAGGKWSDMVQNAAKIGESNTSKLTAVYEKLEEQVASKVLPTVSSMIDGFVKNQGAMDGLVAVVGLAGSGLEKFASLLDTLGLIKLPGKTGSAKDVVEGSKKDAARAKEIAQAGGEENKKAVEAWRSRLGSGSDLNEAATDGAMGMTPMTGRVAAKYGPAPAGPALPPGVSLALPTAGAPPPGSPPIYGPAAPPVAPTSGLKLDPGVVVSVRLVEDRTAKTGVTYTLGVPKPGYAGGK